MGRRASKTEFLQIYEIDFYALEDTSSDALKIAATDLTGERPAESGLYRILNSILADILNDGRTGDALSKVASTSIWKDQNTEKQKKSPQ